MKKSQAIAVAVAEATGFDLTVELTERDIAVIAWKRFPRLFGIRGYIEYPDTKMMSILLSRVSVYSMKNCVCLEKSRPGRWRLTQEGAELAEKLNGS